MARCVVWVEEELHNKTEKIASKSVAVFSAAIHRGKPSPPLPSELKLLEKVESALSASRPAKKASKRPSTREPAHDKGDMSNLTARREYNKTLEGKVKDLNDQKGAAVVSAHAAEERFRVLLSQKEELAAERARLTETLAVLHVEKKSEADLAAQATRVLEVRVAALEADLADETKHTPRIEAAEERQRSCSASAPSSTTARACSSSSRARRRRSAAWRNSSAGWRRSCRRCARRRRSW